jgi:hypothetical protein
MVRPGRRTLTAWARTPSFWVGSPIGVLRSTVRNNAVPAQGVSLTHKIMLSILKACRIRAALAADCHPAIAQRLLSGTSLAFLRRSPLVGYSKRPPDNYSALAVIGANAAWGPLPACPAVQQEARFGKPTVEPVFPPLAPKPGKADKIGRPTLVQIHVAPRV